MDTKITDTFDSNTGNECFVNMEKITFEINDQGKRRRKQTAMLTG